MRPRSSGRPLKSLFALAVGVAIGCGQGQQQEEVTASAVSPVVNSLVGPLPGPAELDPPSANPFGSNDEALARGRRYFVQYNCAGCHGDHGGGGMGPSLRDAQWLYGNSDGHIAKSIAEGRAYGMPAWRAMLTDEQIWEIAAYVKSMRSEREPQPPTG